jgi:RNA polymerase sigma-70 factor (sigma-E family)
MRITDRDAEFKTFYYGQVAALRRLALFVSASPADAEDLTQEALLKAYTAWPRIRNADPGPFVRRTLVNLCRNHHRRKALERRKAPAPDVPTMQPDVAEALRVAEALAVLSPIKRAVVVMRFYEDMSEADIAWTLDRPLNTVKSDLRRALIRLRAELAEGVTA